MNFDIEKHTIADWTIEEKIALSISIKGVRKGFVPIGLHLRGWIWVPQISQGKPSEAIASLRLLSKLLFLDREVGPFSMFSNQLGSACKSQFLGIVRNSNKLYLWFMPDSPKSTYHIEFRYGSDKSQLSKMTEGKYAFWMAAGVREGHEEEWRNGIILFIDERLKDE